MKLTCTGSSCDGEFALLGSWADPASESTATIQTQVEATVQLWGGIAAGRPSVTLTAADLPGQVKPHQNRAVASSDAARARRFAPVSRNGGSRSGSETSRWRSHRSGR